MTFSTPRNFFYAGGAWDLSWLSWIWNNIAPDARAKADLPGPRTGREARAAWKELEVRLRATDVAYDLRNHIYEKLQVHSKSEAVSLALKNRIV